MSARGEMFAENCCAELTTKSITECSSKSTNIQT